VQPTHGVGLQPSTASANHLLPAQERQLEPLQAKFATKEDVRSSTRIFKLLKHEQQSARWLAEDDDSDASVSPTPSPSPSQARSRDSTRTSTAEYSNTPSTSGSIFAVATPSTYAVGETGTVSCTASPVIVAEASPAPSTGGGNVSASASRGAESIRTSPSPAALSSANVSIATSSATASHHRSVSSTRTPASSPSVSPTFGSSISRTPTASSPPRPFVQFLLIIRSDADGSSFAGNRTVLYMYRLSVALALGLPVEQVVITQITDAFGGEFYPSETDQASTVSRRRMQGSTFDALSVETKVWEIPKGVPYTATNLTNTQMLFNKISSTSPAALLGMLMASIDVGFSANDLDDAVTVTEVSFPEAVLSSSPSMAGATSTALSLASLLGMSAVGLVALIAIGGFAMAALKSLLPSKVAPAPPNGKLPRKDNKVHPIPLTINTSDHTLQQQRIQVQLENDGDSSAALGKPAAAPLQIYSRASSSAVHVVGGGNMPPTQELVRVAFSTSSVAGVAIQTDSQQLHPSTGTFLGGYDGYAHSQQTRVAYPPLVNPTNAKGSAIMSHPRPREGPQLRVPSYSGSFAFDIGAAGPASHGIFAARSSIASSLPIRRISSQEQPSPDHYHQYSKHTNIKALI
jgi:hypothetical protein